MHFQGKQLLVFFFFFNFVSCPIGGQLLGERICSSGSRFFPFGVDPILKGLYCPGKHTGSLMGCFPLWKG